MESIITSLPISLFILLHKCTLVKDHTCSELECPVHTLSYETILFIKKKKKPILVKKIIMIFIPFFYFYEYDLYTLLPVGATN